MILGSYICLGEVKIPAEGLWGKASCLEGIEQVLG